MIILPWLEVSERKAVKTFPTVTLFMKGGNWSLTYFGPRDVTNLISFVNDATEPIPPSPKVGNFYS